MADIFLYLDEAQHGPYTAGQLLTWLRDGTVAPDTPARLEGMDGWQALSAVLAYRPPGYVPQAVQEEGFNRKQYFGIGFLAFLLIGGVLAVGAFLVAGAAAEGSVSAEAVSAMGAALVIGYFAAALLALGIGIWLGVKRLQNIGWHGALVLLLLVPVVNLFLAVALIALPPGYARTKKLDGPAWTWIVLIVLFVGLTVFAALSTDGMRHIRELQVQPPPAVSPP